MNTMDDINTAADRPRKKRKHRWAFPLGLAIVALAVVGAVTLISFGVDSIKNLTDKSKQKAEYESFLTQVVRNDPDPFDDISKANKTGLLDSAIWYFLKNDGLTKKAYAYSDTDPIGYIVPAADIAEAYKTLFGEEEAPVYETVEGTGYTFLYNADTDSYIIPLTGADPIYSPKVESIDKKGDSITLTVGYLKFDEVSWDDRGKPVEPAPDKYMIITLRKTDREPGYYVSAIKISVKPGEADEDKKKPATTAEPATEPVTAEVTTAAETALAGETSAETTAAAAP